MRKSYFLPDSDKIKTKTYNGIMLMIKLAGELQEWRNPGLSEVRPPWKWLRAQVSAPREGGRERQGRPPLVCVPEGWAPTPQWWPYVPDERPQAHHLEPGEQERRVLEFWEVPHWAWRNTIQTLQQEFPHQQYRGRHQEPPQSGQIKPVCFTSLHEGWLHLNTSCALLYVMTVLESFYHMKTSSEMCEEGVGWNVKDATFSAPSRACTAQMLCDVMSRTNKCALSQTSAFTVIE